ncbi:MAG: hypothetical protein ACP5US_00140 [Candidatus Kryptoniota bacterium]
MDDNLDNPTNDFIRRKEEEELFAAIITGYLKDRIELDVYPDGVFVREKNHPERGEIFFPFDDNEKGDSEYDQ